MLAIGWYALPFFVNRTVNGNFGGAAMASIEKGPMAVTKAIKGLANEGLASIYKRGWQAYIAADRIRNFQGHVHVLTAAEVDKGNDAIKEAGFIDLGSMKGNKGDQNYDIPADADFNKYKNVTIGCARFGVNFGQAALEAPISIPVKVAEGNFRGSPMRPKAWRRFTNWRTVRTSYVSARSKLPTARRAHLSGPLRCERRFDG